MEMQSLTLPDGRNLEVVTAGKPGSSAIVFHHGTPGAWNTWEGWLPVVEEQGGFAIAFSRAGYGLSDRKRGRTVISNSDDTKALMNYFDVKEFVSIGWSGGGPHCLADTNLAQNRAAISIAGVGAYGVPDLDFLEGMGEENHVEFSAALNGESAIDAWMKEFSPTIGNATGAEIIEAMGGLLSEVDKKALEGSGAEVMAASYRHGLSVSYMGWLDDDLAFVEPWGFDIGAIHKPVELWQGDEDFMVPHSHGEWLKKHIPHAEYIFVPGEGHVSLDINRRGEIISHGLAYLN